MWHKFIISTFVSIIAQAIKEKPDGRLAKLILNRKVKNTVRDLSGWYIQMEIESGIDLDEDGAGLDE